MAACNAAGILVNVLSSNAVVAILSSAQATLPSPQPSSKSAKRPLNGPSPTASDIIATTRDDQDNDMNMTGTIVSDAKLRSESSDERRRVVLQPCIEPCAQESFDCAQF